MKVAQGEYLILRVGERPALARCSAVPGEGKKSMYKANLCKEQDTDKKTVIPVEFNLNEVMANLGKMPPVGTAYGQKIEPLLKTRTSKLWEEIRLYKHLDEKEESELISQISIAHKRLRELKCGDIKIELEVRQEQGKYSGMYKFYPKRESDIMIVKPKQNLEGMHEIVWHEFGHGVWFRKMTPRQRLQWIKLYHAYVALTDVTEKDLAEICEEVESAGSINDFVKEADEQTLMIFKVALRQITQVHGLNKRHLDLALTQGESIADYWPVSLELSEKEMIITDYARKSPEEFFAEAFTLQVAKKKLPKRVRLLMEETLSKLTAAAGAVAPRKPSAEDMEESKKKSKKNKRKKGLK